VHTPRQVDAGARAVSQDARMDPTATVEQREGVWAHAFHDIPMTLTRRPDLRARMRVLLTGDMPNMVTDGDVAPGVSRLDLFRAILGEAIDGAITLDETIALTARGLARETSPHRASNRVFAHGWEDRLVRTHLSRLYSQAVLELLAEAGQSRCFVPHVDGEALDAPCTRLLAGRAHDVRTLHDRLVRCYVRGDGSGGAPMVPNHPHCAHVISPVLAR
jgi:hypothetical protein